MQSQIRDGATLYVNSITGASSSRDRTRGLLGENSEGAEAKDLHTVARKGGIKALDRIRADLQRRYRGVEAVHVRVEPEGVLNLYELSKFIVSLVYIIPLQFLRLFTAVRILNCLM